MRQTVDESKESYDPQYPPGSYICGLNCAKLSKENFKTSFAGDRFQTTSGDCF